MMLEQRLSRILVENHPAEASRILERMDPAEGTTILSGMPSRAAASALRAMDPSRGAACLVEWPDETVGEVLAEVAPDVAARLLERIPASRRRSLIERIPDEASDPILRLLKRAEGTAGALMDPRIGILPDDITIADARKRHAARVSNALYYLYVVDRSGRLVGVLTLHELRHARATDAVSSVMRKDVASLSAQAGREAILAHPGWNDHHALPVVDRGGELVGALRYGTMRRLEVEAAGRAVDEIPAGFGIVDLYLRTASALLGGMMGMLETAEHRAERETADDQA